MQENFLPKYEPPAVVTYTDEEILEELGPARAGSGGCNLPILLVIIITNKYSQPWNPSREIMHFNFYFSLDGPVYIS